VAMAMHGLGAPEGKVLKDRDDLCPGTVST
jgi:hypothetical protein